MFLSQYVFLIKIYFRGNAEYEGQPGSVHAKDCGTLRVRQQISRHGQGNEPGLLTVMAQARSTNLTLMQSNSVDLERQ